MCVVIMESTKYNITGNRAIKRPNVNEVEQNKKMKIESFTTKSKPISQDYIFKQRQSLPVFKSRTRIINAIREHASVILIGETASGKTTQVPQFILETGLAKNKMIAVTQPRRVAAITVAQRVASERNSNIGEVVGYAVRFEDMCSLQTKLKFLTDGLLLREAMLDPLLLAYNVIILDEAHERTIATDVLFGVVKVAQQKRVQQRAPLKVVIMSATMDVDAMRAYFTPNGNTNPIPVVWVEGRTHQVEVHQTVKPQEDYLMASLTTLFMIHRSAPINEGVLVFLTGQEEIEAMAATIPNLAREENSHPIQVIPLYSALPQDQQALAFKRVSVGCRKVVLATNIAETSVTIADIRHVIDSGMVKARNHLPGTGLDILKVQRISQAQAWQRTGRAGREASGTCYRCYTKQDFNKMQKITEPEILRVNLTSVVLQLLIIGVSKVSEFDFLDKPSQQGLDDAIEQLKALGAITILPSSNELRLTPIGRRMAQFPLDAHLSRVLLSSADMGCRDEILSLVALLSGEGVVVTPTANRRNEAHITQAKFSSSNGDHETLLNIYRGFCAASQKKMFCMENSLSFRALHQATQVREQLEELCERADLPSSSCGTDLAVVRHCLLTGLFSNVALHQRDKLYLTVSKHHVVSLHPSSVLFSVHPPPACVLYTELVHTARSYMRQVSVVEPSWIAELHPELARRLPATIANK